jgi:hypothetical protein
MDFAYKMQGDDKYEVGKGQNTYIRKVYGGSTCGQRQTDRQIDNQTGRAGQGKAERDEIEVIKTVGCGRGTGP